MRNLSSALLILLLFTSCGTTAQTINANSDQLAMSIVDSNGKTQLQKNVNVDAIDEIKSLPHTFTDLQFCSKYTNKIESLSCKMKVGIQKSYFEAVKSGNVDNCSKIESEDMRFEDMNHRCEVVIKINGSVDLLNQFCSDLADDEETVINNLSEMEEVSVEDLCHDAMTKKQKIDVL